VGLVIEKGAQLAQGQEDLFGACGLAAESLAIELDRLRAAALAHFFELRRLEPQGHLQLRLARRLGGPEQALHVRRRRRGDLREVLEARAGRGLLGLDGDQLDELLARRRQVPLALEHVRGLVDERPRFSGAGEGEGDPQRGDHAVEAILLHVARAHDGEGALACLVRRPLVGEHPLRQGAGDGVVGEGGGGEQALDFAQCLAGLGEVVEVEGRQALPQLDGVVARHHGQAPRQHPGEGCPIGLPLEQAFELGGDLEVAGGGLEQALQVLRRARGVARVARDRGGVTQ